MRNCFDCMGNWFGGSSRKSSLEVSPATGTCAVGERTGKENLAKGSIPVISCEGACIRGEIARQAANMVAKHGNFKRCCHGELFTVPDSSMAVWGKNAPKIVCIDGCFLKCHSRVLENLVSPSQLIVFDALSHYQKYNDVFDIDDVPEEERKAVARDVADWVIKCVEEGSIPTNKNTGSCNCSC